MRTIKSKQDFERTFKEGRRYNHPLVRMTIRESVNEGDPGRVAFVAAKRLGNAVYRNRSKRVLREAARSFGMPFEGLDIILFATPATAAANPDDMNIALDKLAGRARIASAGC